MACPQCGAQLLERISRKGRKFYGCERYPDCDYVSWKKPGKEGAAEEEAQVVEPNDTDM